MAFISKTELAAAVKQGRSTMIATWSKPVLEHQRQTTTDPAAKGNCWVSRILLQAPQERDLLQVVLDAVNDLGDSKLAYTLPNIMHVPAQWTGFRAGVTRHEPEPNATEEQKYKLMMNEASNPLTILYAYGGAHYVNGPATRRATAAKLAELTRGRCLIVQHRFAPQNTFPAQIVDIFSAYLSLLYPPPGSLHEAVPASNVVFAGDSSGSELQFALIQIILNMRRRQNSQRPSLMFHGRRVEVLMPAGVTAQSPAMDHLAVLPSWYANRGFDLFSDVMPGYLPGFPVDEAWPTDPPRGSFYCETPMLSHPLVSPLMARNWTGAPPFYIAVGSTERISDSVKFVAQTAARQGVHVIWDEYELMPHNWPMVFPKLAHSTRCYRNWSEACLMFLKTGQVSSYGNLTKFEDLSIENVDVRNLTSLAFDDIQRIMRAEQKKLKPFTGEPSVKAML